jgi:hypothetical protein
MIRRHLYSAGRNAVILFGAAIFPLVCGCGNNSSSQQGAAVTTSSAKEALPAHGKLKQATPPTKAVFGMIYINTTNNLEYIYDGNEWVPHSNAVDSYYKTKPLPQTVSKAASSPLATSCASYDCNPGGAHMKHSAYNCTTCHMMHGGARFDPNGPAAIKPTLSNMNPPKPVFNAIDKSCSNIACHSVPAGTFSYYFPGGDGEPALNTVSYGGANSASSPSWYAVGAGCGSCHGNPPPFNVWHSGSHATGILGANECQFCHPDATGAGGKGTSITNTALHQNGMVDVQATFTSKCFSCH